MKLRYLDQFCVIATMHSKEEAIGPSFETLLGCKLIQAKINTDMLGTFTGEVERKLSPLNCVKEKCYQGIKAERGHLGIASEGSFGAHPLIPFVHADHELLFFADTNLGFELTLSKISLETNFSGNFIQTKEELLLFAEKALFPSHALIIRSSRKSGVAPIYKGIQNREELIFIFEESLEDSTDRKVWVETDMRAHMNPTRMKVIQDLAYEMALRLATSCPACNLPGWGIVKKLSGLECSICGCPTQLTLAEVYGCTKCDYQETVPLNKELADPKSCQFCNP